MSTYNPSSKKLSESVNYDRPVKTITELTQTKKEIQERLKDFEEISDEDLPYVSLKTQLRYISYDQKNKKELFRFGGLLIKVDKEYLVLAGKEGLRFSVQRYTKNNNGEIIHTTRFFKRVNETDILKSELDDTINKSTKIIRKQDEIIDKQKRELLALKKQLGIN